MVRFAEYDQLEDYVRSVLCQHADFDLATPLLPMVINKRGKPCGVEFTLVAPRSVRLSAIWEAQSGRILFYDQNLERFQVTTIRGLTIDQLPRQTEQHVVRSMWSGK